MSVPLGPCFNGLSVHVLMGQAIHIVLLCALAKRRGESVGLCVCVCVCVFGNVCGWRCHVSCVSHVWAICHVYRVCFSRAPLDMTYTGLGKHYKDFPKQTHPTLPPPAGRDGEARARRQDQSDDRVSDPVLLSTHAHFTTPHYRQNCWGASENIRSTR